MIFDFCLHFFWEFWLFFKMLFDIFFFLVGPPSHILIDVLICWMLVLFGFYGLLTVHPKTRRWKPDNNGFLTSMSNFEREVPFSDSSFAFGRRRICENFIITKSSKNLGVFSKKKRRNGQDIDENMFKRSQISPIVVMQWSWSRSTWVRWNLRRIQVLTSSETSACPFV